MKEVDLCWQLTDLKKQLELVKELVKELNVESSQSNDLWDSSDMIRNWNISQRTLSDWRSKGLIGYVQVGNKIWYPRQQREDFLTNNLKNKVTYE